MFLYIIKSYYIIKSLMRDFNYFIQHLVFHDSHRKFSKSISIFKIFLSCNIKRKSIILS